MGSGSREHGLGLGRQDQEGIRGLMQPAALEREREPAGGASEQTRLKVKRKCHPGHIALGWL